MSAPPRTDESLALQQLYGAEDLAAYQQVLGRLLHELFDVERFAITLLDRRRKAFLEMESGEGVGKRLSGGDALRLLLTVQGGDLGALHLPATAVDDDGAIARFAQHVGLALYYHKFIDQQSRLIDESLAHVQALKAMGELLGELDEELVLTQILKFFVDLVDAEVGAALLRDESRAVAEARWGLPAELLVELVAAVDEGRVEGEGIFQQVRLPAGRFASFSMATVLHLPIALKPPHRAQVFLVSGERLDVGAHRQELIRSCLNIGGIALQKALDHREQIRQHRLNEQLKVAKEIQSKLLPAELPRLEQLDIAGVSLPALAVGGDYYDVLALPGGDLLAIVADVSGKGIQAAIRMSGLQAMVHSLVFQDLRPGEVLGRLNELLVTSRLRGHFVTACVLRLEQGGRRVRMASAGHEAILRARAGEPGHAVEALGGIPLGLRSGQEYPESTFTLDDGDRLLIYTDGMTDARDPSGALYGAERLSDRLAAGADESAAALLDRLVDDLERYRGEQPWPDDLTALTFHYQSEGKQ